MLHSFDGPYHNWYLHSCQDQAWLETKCSECYQQPFAFLRKGLYEAELSVLVEGMLTSLGTQPGFHLDDLKSCVCMVKEEVGT